LKQPAVLTPATWLPHPSWLCWY